jgi:hypothetical protein
MRILILTSLLFAPCLQAADLGGDSPAALVERLRAAAKNEDFGELAACLAPAARKEMAIGIWIGSTMMIGMSAAMGDMAVDMGEGMAEAMGAESEEAKAQAAKAKEEMAKKFEGWKSQYDAAAKKHGLPLLGAEEAAMSGDPEALFATVDLVALTRDFGALLKLVGEDGEGKKDVEVPQGQLENLKVEGDKATGQLDGEAIEFVKVDGRWFIAELPKKDQGPPGGLDSGPGGNEEEADTGAEDSGG